MSKATSIQFLPQVKTGSPRLNPRLNSPPPPALFTPRVSFDTFDNRLATDLSLTLSRKHKQYAYSKRSRTFLCGTDINEYSDTALEWLLDELVEDGDEVVCLRVVDKDSKEARELAGPASARDKTYQGQAQVMLERILTKNSDDRAINLILEFAVGKVHETFQHMIRIYEPALLVVGTRGRSLSGFQGLMPGSISKYCLQHSPVPVVVVRPSSKRDKKKRKRQRDPSRRGYRDILDKSEDVGHPLDERNRNSFIVPGSLSELGIRDAEEEARMVAEAVGYRKVGSDAGSARPPTRASRSGSINSIGSDVTDTNNNYESSPPMSDESDSDDSVYEQIPAYVKAQEEAYNRARERGLKAQDEEAENALLREAQKNSKPSVKKKTTKKTEGGGAAAPSTGVLSVLDDLKAQEKQKSLKLK